MAIHFFISFLEQRSRLAYRPGNLYLDESKAFYKSLNNGELRKGSLLNFLNPWSSVRL